MSQRPSDQDQTRSSTSPRDGVYKSGVPDLDGVAASRLAEQVRALRESKAAEITVSESTPPAGTTGQATSSRTTNPRVIRALANGEHLLPPKPDIITGESISEWLKHVLPLMDRKSRYRKDLASIVSRYDAKKRQEGQNA